MVLTRSFFCFNSLNQSVEKSPLFIKAPLKALSCIYIYDAFFRFPAIIYIKYPMLII